MNRPMCVTVALTLALALFVAPSPPVQATPHPKKHRKLAGTWKLRGWNMGVNPKHKESYTGEVIVQSKGKNTFHVSWKIGGKVVNTGVGIYDPGSDTFAAGYAIGSSPGVAIWTFSKGGKKMFCTGTFAKKLGHVAHEEWTR